MSTIIIIQNITIQRPLRLITKDEAITICLNKFRMRQLRMRQHYMVGSEKEVAPDPFGAMTLKWMPVVSQDALGNWIATNADN